MQLLFAEQCFPGPISTSPKALWRACQENPWRLEQPVHQRAHYVCLNAACKGTSVEQISAGIDATLKSRKSLQNAKDLAVWAVTKPRGTLQTAGVLSLKSAVHCHCCFHQTAVFELCASPWQSFERECRGERPINRDKRHCFTRFMLWGSDKRWLLRLACRQRWLDTEVITITVNHITQTKKKIPVRLHRKNTPRIIPRGTHTQKLFKTSVNDYISQHHSGDVRHNGPSGLTQE